MSKSSTTPSIAAIRRALRAEFGPRKYRITREGEVHVRDFTWHYQYHRGWRLFGYLGNDREVKHLLFKLNLDQG
jgi:hypothetical protein